MWSRHVVANAEAFLGRREQSFGIKRPRPLEPADQARCSPICSSDAVLAASRREAVLGRQAAHELLRVVQDRARIAYEGQMILALEFDELRAGNAIGDISPLF